MLYRYLHLLSAETQVQESVKKKKKMVLENLYLSGEEVWSVGLQDDAVQGDPPDRVPGLGGPLVGDQRREAHAEVGELFQERLDHRVAVGETVPAAQRREMNQQGQRGRLTNLQ